MLQFPDKMISGMIVLLRSDFFQKRLYLYIALFLVLLPPILQLRIVPYQIDDAFIVYRYIVNFLQEGRIVFNIRDVPVEGVTSPLWFLLLTFLAKTNQYIAIHHWGPIAGVTMFYLQGLMCAVFIGKKWGKAAGVFMAVAMLLLPTHVYYSVTGLETCLYSLLFMAATLSVIGLVQHQVGIMAVFLLIWARPEGMMFFSVPVLAAFFTSGFAGLRSKRLIEYGITIAASVALLFLVRWQIFHEILPNTYYSKIPVLSEGWHSLKVNLHEPWFVVVPLLGIAGAFWGDRIHRAMAVGALLWTIIAVSEGGDIMPLARFYLPASLLWLLASCGIFYRFPQRAPVISAALMVILAYLFVIAIKATTLPLRYTLLTVTQEDRLFIEWLETTHSSSIALIDIGELGYQLPQVTILDLGGLVDKHIGKLSGSHMARRIDDEYLAQHATDVILVRLNRPPREDSAGNWSITPDIAVTLTEAWILNSVWMKENYQVAFAILPGYQRQPYSGKLVYVRKGAPYARFTENIPGPEIFKGLPVLFTKHPDK